jgi:hypothetical protein
MPMGVRPEPRNAQGNVFGSGLLMDPDNKLTIFFTLNGILLGEFFSEDFINYNGSQKICLIFLINFQIFEFYY